MKDTGIEMSELLWKECVIFGGIYIIVAIYSLLLSKLKHWEIKQCTPGEYTVNGKVEFLNPDLLL